MQNFTRLFILLIICAFGSQAQGQRYVTEVFDDVVVSDLQGAGENFTVLGWVFAASQGQPGNTIKQPLVYQSYTPAGDTETERPVVLYVHTGNFFPFPANGSCGGTLQDSTAIEICTRLAKMGYVALSVDYRAGWLPTHPEELVRRFSLINAAYRGVQDLNTYIRFLKRTAAEFGNPLGIDPEKIVVWGQGTGGYLSLGTAYLNDYQEILNTSDPNKFLLPTMAGPIPMIIEAYNGDINGTNESPMIPDTTIVDATYNAITQLPIGDTLTIPNHVGYDSDFHLAVNMGGALGDTTWVSAGEVPLISFHVETDPFAPYRTDVLLVPTAQGPQPVVEVSGSYDTQSSVHRLGLNDIFETIPDGKDPYGENLNSDFNGLYPFKNTFDDSSAPWEWTDLNNPELIAMDCNGDASRSHTYIDTIIGYYAPRACVALNLDCYSSSTDEILDASLVQFTPNPTQGNLNITAEENMESIQVFDISGRLVKTVSSLGVRNYRMDREGINNGMHIIQIRFEEGVVSQKVLFE